MGGGEERESVCMYVCVCERERESEREREMKKSYESNRNISLLYFLLFSTRFHLSSWLREKIFRRNVLFLEGFSKSSYDIKDFQWY